MEITQGNPLLQRGEEWSGVRKRAEFPALRRRLPTLWTRSYFVGTAGTVSAATIQRYIAAQKGV